MPDRILVFVPCYNCAPQIVRVVAQFEGLALPGVAEILVVDNRSTDGTAQVAATALETCGLPWTVVRNDENYSLGGSHKVAFSYALAKGHTHVIVLHGDDQGRIADIVPHLEAGTHRRVDALLGARFAPGAELHGYSAFRKFGNLVFNALFSVACRQAVYDLGSGLNLFGRKMIEEGDHRLAADDLTFNVFLLLTMAYRRRVMMFFPIHWHESDQVSNAKLFAQSRRMMKLLAAYLASPGRALARDRGRPGARYTYQIVAQGAK